MLDKITTLKFPTFWFDPTPQGKFMLSIAFGQSKYYVDNLSENIKRGIRQKLRNGIWPAWAPLGYLNDKNQRKIVVDKEKAKYIKRAFEMYSTGEYPLAQIRKIINSLGLVGKKGKMLSVSNYQYMLKNPIYYGVIEYNGEFYDGKHEPIITKKLFDSVQEVMARKSKPKTPKLKPYVYRGFFRCGECGCFITTETQKGHNYLRCTKRKNPCSQRYVREEIITSQIKEEIKKEGWFVERPRDRRAQQTTIIKRRRVTINVESKPRPGRLGVAMLKRIMKVVIPAQAGMTKEALCKTLILSFRPALSFCRWHSDLLLSFPPSFPLFSQPALLRAALWRAFRF